MTGRLARIWLLAAAMASDPSRCDARRPDDVDGPARPAPAPTAAEIDAFPSSVSPSIARFMERHGDEVPPAPPAGAAVSLGRPPQDAAAASPPDASAEQEAEPASPPPELPSPSAYAAGAIESLALKPAPFDPGDQRFPINLAAALRLADARPLIVAAAQAGVWVSEAQLTRAKVVWVPTALIGFDYTRHDGGGPDFNKGIMTAPSANYFMGGAGLNLYVNVTDAVFQPLVARRVLDSSQWNVQAAKNDALMQTADAYFRVHQYRGTYAGALYTLERGRDLIAKVEELSRELVPKDEVARARNVVADLEQRSVLARQEWRVAGADLTQVLRLDPRAVVEPLEHDHAQITLIDPGRTLDDLMPVALANRPELASRRALVQAAETRVDREKWRPALPMLSVNGFQHPGFTLQAGIFGLGPNASMDQWRGRSDVTLQVVWQLEQFGLGNLAKIKQQRGLESRALIDFRRAQDGVAADVTRARARVQSAAARVLQADRALRTGIVAFNGHLEGLKQTRRLGDVLVLTFRPQEAVYSLDLLSVAFNEYYATVAEYNRAQFDLFHALGYPAREIAQLRNPGDAVAVDTERPAYLPRVGHGPPPATR
ncbi:TolC family protein [Paludisphaera mucosa]|uniref:TolC family protein n=1 Tax=Paludisphaera mucosa TaxID=3030827 RepID=A0ABT6FAU7_9BACT|nr:TolC family protein [Paludisphaera mucosa]MDG3004616.1 TolC family protein [Paludisphaera mucosa]